MISKRLAIPTIRVIFPRILALLSAEATVERLVLCTMWINKTSTMKLGGIILKKTWMIPTNARCFFQTITYCRVQLVKKKRIALRKRWSNREQVTTAQQRIFKWKFASCWKYCYIWIVWSLHTIVQSPNPSRCTLRILKAGREAFDSRSLGRKCHSKLDYLDRGTHHQEQKLDL